MKLATKTTDTRLEPQPRGYAPSEPAMGSLTDADLLDGWSRDQHPAALAALAERYSVMVLSVCRRRCRTEADAEDAFQTTFLYLASNGHKIRQPERLAGWLQRVAQRAAVATTKSSKRETEPMVEPPADPDDPLDRLTQRHEAIVLDEELAELPEHYRSALVMHVYEGRPLQYLAEHFGTTMGSIRGRLQRGKQLLARRLRHRGVVPILAFAAANALTVSASSAVQASESFIKTTGEGPLPDPPIDTALLESLLAQGVRLMPSIYTVAGVVAGSALLVFALTSSGPTHGQSGNGQSTLTLSAAPEAAVMGQIGPTVTAAGNAASTNVATANGVTANSVKAAIAKVQQGGVTGGFGGGMTPPLVWTDKPVIPTPTTKIARQVNEALDADTTLNMADPLSELSARISEVAGIPVFFDDRGVGFAEVDLEGVNVRFDQANVPLRAALRSILKPHGLRAVVEDEGLVITADPSALVHQGIGTTRWINVDEEAEKKIAASLDEETQLELLEMPLLDAIQTISETHHLPMLIDRRALDEIGLSDDAPVTLTIAGVKLQSALNIMLSDLDLVVTVRGETLLVTTAESESLKLLGRIYWLESTGIAAGDYQTIVEMIQSSIEPDTWEEMGGPSTIAPLGSSRPGLLISTTYQVHQSIDRLIQTLRESHFGVDPVLERVQVPSSQNLNYGGGGGGGGGFGGGGGGFF